MIYLLKETRQYSVLAHRADVDVLFMIWKRITGDSEESSALEMMQYTDEFARKLVSESVTKEKVFICSVSLKGAEVAPPDALYFAAEMLKNGVDVYHAWAHLNIDTAWRSELLVSLTWAVAKLADYAVPHRPFGSYIDVCNWLYLDYRVDKCELQSSFENILDAIINKKQFLFSI